MADHNWNEIVVNGRANIYVNGFGFDFLGGESPTPGIIALITPEGTARPVATDIDFPNGMVITPDNATLIISESFAGRLTAFDIAADGGYPTGASGPTSSAPTESVSTPMVRCGRRPQTPARIPAVTTLLRVRAYGSEKVAQCCNG